MPSLLDTLDRFSYNATAIRTLTRSQPSRTSPGPFTAAILELTLHDLLREADEAEYGLFSFVKESSDVSREGLPSQGKVGRREYRGAAPLRTKHDVGTSRDEEPEVYLEAALKYLDHFHAVKPMLHARKHLESLIDRLHHSRDNIEKLQASMEEITQTGRQSPKSQIVEEERRIGELKSRIIQLRKRKEALASKFPPDPKLNSRVSKPSSRPVQPSKSKFASPSSASTSTQSTPGTESSRPRPRPKSHIASSAKPRARASGLPSGKSIPLCSNSNNDISSPVTDEKREEEHERLFWSGGKPPRITDKSDSLLDEEMDMTGLDSALMSPPPATPSSSRVSVATDGDRNDESEYETRMDEELDDSNDEDSESGEPTIVAPKLGLSSAPVTSPPSPPPSRPVSQSSVAEPQTPVQSIAEASAPPSAKTKLSRVRITVEVERTCAKIWSTIPDLLVPGNNFTSPGKHPPNAKDTIKVLQTIAAQPIPDPSSNVASPSTRSTLSSLLGIEILGPPAGGSTHQIMTALVLHSLLTAPNQCMPLTALKALLTSKTAVPSPGADAGREAKQNAAAIGASAAQAGTRALYGCVAKKLVKIDRGGGEQIVKFE